VKPHRRQRRSVDRLRREHLARHDVERSADDFGVRVDLVDDLARFTGW